MLKRPKCLLLSVSLSAAHPAVGVFYPDAIHRGHMTEVLASLKTSQPPLLDGIHPAVLKMAEFIILALAALFTQGNGQP